jgi:Na+-driven multidrug efflux pump
MSADISFKNINRLAIPALIAGVAEPLISLTDTAIVGNVDLNATESLAAVGIVATFLSMLIWVFGQSRSAISSLVSQYLGANNLEAIKSLPAQAILVMTLLSILIIGTFSNCTMQITSFLITASNITKSAFLGFHLPYSLLLFLGLLEVCRTPFTQWSLRLRALALILFWILFWSMAFKITFQQCISRAPLMPACLRNLSWPYCL